MDARLIDDCRRLHVTHRWLEDVYQQAYDTHATLEATWINARALRALSRLQRALARRARYHARG